MEKRSKISSKPKQKQVRKAERGSFRSLTLTKDLCEEGIVDGGDKSFDNFRKSLEEDEFGIPGLAK